MGRESYQLHQPLQRWKGGGKGRGAARGGGVGGGEEGAGRGQGLTMPTSQLGCQQPYRYRQGTTQTVGHLSSQ